MKKLEISCIIYIQDKEREIKLKIIFLFEILGSENLKLFQISAIIYIESERDVTLASK